MLIGAPASAPLAEVARPGADARVVAAEGTQKRVTSGGPVRCCSDGEDQLAPTWERGSRASTSCNSRQTAGTATLDDAMIAHTRSGTRSQRTERGRRSAVAGDRGALNVRPYIASRPPPSPKATAAVSARQAPTAPVTSGPPTAQRRGRATVWFRHGRSSSGSVMSRCAIPPSCCRSTKR